MSKMPIKFYREDETNGHFSNYFSAPLKVRILSKLDEKEKITTDSVWLITELTWPTAEHLFQALKFSESDKINQAEKITKLLKSSDAKVFPQEKIIRNDWHQDYKMRAMR